MLAIQRCLLAVALVAALQSLPALSAGEESTGQYLPARGCPEDRLCLYHPRGCLSSQKCTAGLTIRKDTEARNTDGSYLFEMSASYRGYVAVALAELVMMGNDSVVECAVNPRTGRVEAFMSRNHPTSIRPRNKRLPAEDQNGVTQVSGKFVDGVIACVVRRKSNTTVIGKTYSLESGHWILQLAAGNNVKEDNIRHHDLWVRSILRYPLRVAGGLVDLMSSSEDQHVGSKSASAATRPAMTASLLGLLGLGLSAGHIRHGFT